jgi:hypothetical protein
MIQAVLSERAVLTKILRDRASRPMMADNDDNSRPGVYRLPGSRSCLQYVSPMRDQPLKRKGRFT